MIWTENTIKYVHDRLCTKYRSWDCKKCPLERWDGCRIGLMLNELKDWAEKNISEDVLRRKSDVSE
jgi:hypothetical protein